MAGPPLLSAHGVCRGHGVALLMARSTEAIIVMLAALKTGAAYLAIDPALPDARVGFMLTDAAPVVAVTTADLRLRLAGHDLAIIDIGDPAVKTQPSTSLPARSGECSAYLVYTLGATGT